MSTSIDVATYVTNILAPWDCDFDIDGIVRDLIEDFDVTGPAPEISLDDIDEDEFYAICKNHDLNSV